MKLIISNQMHEGKNIYIVLYSQVTFDARPIDVRILEKSGRRKGRGGRYLEEWW